MVETDRPNGPGPQPSQRLDSWKEIATYLRRHVRTVQRWENEEGLPVHRRQANGPESRWSPRQVFAFTSELDAWWEAYAAQNPANGAPPRRWVAGAAVVVAAIGVLGLAWYFIATRPSDGPVKALAAEVWMASGGAVSPDGTRLAYQDGETLQLRVRDLASGEERWHGTERVYSLSWAYDRDRLALTVQAADAYRLDVLDLDLAARHTIRTYSSVETLPRVLDWTPDGEQLLCRMADRSLAYVSTHDGTETPLPLLPGFREARLSPNGRFLVYDSVRNGNSDIYVRPVFDPGGEIRITTHADNDWFPFWSQNGRQVLFSRWHGPLDDNSLWSVEIEPETGSPLAAPRLLSTMLQPGGLRPTLLATGELFISDKRQESAVGLMSVDPETGQPTSPPRFPFPKHSVFWHWSPEDGKLVYRSYQTAHGRVFVEYDLSTDESKPFQIPRPPGWMPGDLYDVAWSPDRRRMAFARRSGTTLRELDLDRNRVEVLAELDRPLALGLSLRGSPDRALIVTRGGGSPFSYDVAVLERSGPALLELGSSPVPAYPDLSPDGTTVAFTNGNCLRTVTDEGLDTTLACADETAVPDPELLFSPSRAAILWLNEIGPSWSPDGRHLVWPVLRDDVRRGELWVVDSSTGDHTVVWTGEPDYVTLARNASWSPDGRWIAFTLETLPKVQIWRMRDF